MGDAKAVQLAVQLAGEKGVTESESTSHSLSSRLAASDYDGGPTVLTIGWGARFGLGASTPAVKAVRAALYAPAGVDDADAPTGARRAADAEVSAEVRQAFDDADRNRDGTIDTRELNTALQGLGMAASAEPKGGSIPTKLLACALLFAPAVCALLVAFPALSRSIPLYPAMLPHPSVLPTNDFEAARRPHLARRLRRDDCHHEQVRHVAERPAVRT